MRYSISEGEGGDMVGSWSISELLLACWVGVILVVDSAGDVVVDEGGTLTLVGLLIIDGCHCMQKGVKKLEQAFGIWHSI